MGNRLIKNIVQQFQDIQGQENWLDENFEKKIENIAEEQAFKRPSPGLHSVAELISHLLVWRNESMLKLKGQEGNLTKENPENWRPNEELKVMGWDKLKSNFYNSQKELVRLIENQPDEFLDNKYKDGYKFKYLIEGLIHRDLSHLGQIGITTKFFDNGSI